MKMFTIYTSVVAIIIMSIAPASAYKVTLVNTTPYEIRVDACGEHLFWRDHVDASVNVSKRSTGSCSLPEGICIYMVIFNYTCIHTDGNAVKEYPFTIYENASDSGFCVCHDLQWKAVQDAADSAGVVFKRE